MTRDLESSRSASSTRMLLAAGGIIVATFGYALLDLPSIATPARAGSQYVIVGSEPSSDAFEPGKILEVEDTIEIPEGTIVTLLGEDGSVNAIPGPARITVTEDAVQADGGADPAKAEEKRSALSQIASLLSGERGNADTLGATRSFSGKQKPQGLNDPWAVSVHGGGHGCVRGETVVLARSDADKAAALTVDNGEGGVLKGAEWKEGESQFELPADIPATSAEIEIRHNGQRSLVQLHLVPDAINQKNPVEVMGWMITSGCEGQALAMTKQLTAEAQ